MKKLKEYLATIWRALRSKTVISSIAGFGIFACVKQGWLPDSLMTQSIEGLTFVLAAIFRVIAVTDIRANVPLTTEPTTVTVTIPATAPPTVEPGKPTAELL